MTTTRTESTTLPAQAGATLESLVIALNSHDAAGFAACFAPHGAVRIVPTGDEVQGREAIAAFLELEFQAFPDWQIAERGIDLGADCVWAQWTITGTHAGTFMGYPATHRAFELRGCSRFAFAPDGSIAEEALYFDPATKLRQLGLAPGA